MLNLSMKLNNILILFLLTVVLFSGGVIGATCTAGWTFIDKEDYNVCYLPNVLQQNSLNITDNNNNTMFSYRIDSHTDITNTIGRNYYINFSTLKNYNGTDYITFYGNASDGNQSSRGMLYFLNDFIYIIYEKDLFANYTGSMRLILDTYNIDRYENLYNGGLYYNNQTGTGFLATSLSTVKFISNGSTLKNFTISGQYYKIALNKTYETKFINQNNINLSLSVTINTSDFYSPNQGGMIDLRKENQTYIRNAIDVYQNTEEVFTRYGGGVIITFNDTYFETNSQLSKNLENGFYNGLTGFQRYATSCVTNYSTYQHSCTPWLWRGLNTQIYLSKVRDKDIYDKIASLSNTHLSLLFLNTNNQNKTAMMDYNFLPSSGNNYFNNTHTRLVADSLIFLLNKKDKTESDNQTILTFINHLETIPFNLPLNNKETIPHSTGTNYIDDQSFVINTHTIGTNSLLIAKLYGYNINETLLNNLINQSKEMYSEMFNETLGNVSYYRVYSNGVYHSNKSYGGFVYISLEMQDYLNFYQYTKDEIHRTIFLRKLNEMNNAFNNLNYISPSNITSYDYNINSDEFQLSRAKYTLLNKTAFNHQWTTNGIVVSQPFYNIEKIPNGNEYAIIYHPIYLGNNNQTYFLNKIDKIEFETPKYAMINDFKYNNNQTGMIIYTKWAYNTSGNFTNLSNPAHLYFYSPQHKRFINYSENLNWLETENQERLWIGNLSNSVNFRGEDGLLDIYSDDEELGEYNTSILNKHSINKNIILKTMSNALIYNTNGSLLGNSNINLNDGEINITLPPNNASYVLDNFNVTEGLPRENSPITLEVDIDTYNMKSYRIKSNITNNLTIPLVLSVSSCDFRSVTLTPKNQSSYTPEYVCEGRTLIIQEANLSYSLDSNELLLVYDPCPGSTVPLLELAVLFMSLAILILSIGFAIYDPSIKSIILAIIGISVGSAFIPTTVNIINSACLI